MAAAVISAAVSCTGSGPALLNARFVDEVFRDRIPHFSVCFLILKLKKQRRDEDAKSSTDTSIGAIVIV